MKKVSSFLLFLFAMTFIGCGASPEEVCEKQVEIMKEEGIDLPEEYMTECVKLNEDAKEQLGMSKWKDYSNCIMDSKNAEDLVKCEP